MTLIYDNIINSLSLNGTSVNVQLYVSFTTQTSGFLSNLQLVLSTIFSSGLGYLTASLYNNYASKPYPCPGDIISTLLIIPDLGIVSSSPTIYDFSNILITNPFLQGNTRYWIGLSGFSSGVQWNFTKARDGYGVSGEFFNMGGVSFSADKNGSYQLILQSLVQ